MAERDACLHLLMPQRRIVAAWAQLRGALGDNDAVVLLAGGCHLAQLAEVVDQARRRPVYAVADELRAGAGQAAAGAGLRVIDWPELVALCADYTSTRSWM